MQLNNSVLAEYQGNTGGVIEVQFDGQAVVCTCNPFKEYGHCKHVMDYTDGAGNAAVRVQDWTYSNSKPAVPPTPAANLDGVDAPDHEKPGKTFEDEDVDAAVKRAARMMRGEES